MKRCPRCGGRGLLPAEHHVTSGGTRKTLPAADCRRCGGSGRVPTDDADQHESGAP